jgi:hypothetical protein
MLLLAQDAYTAFGVAFVRLWRLEIMDERPEIVARDAAIELAEWSTAALGARPMALVARRNKRWSGLDSRKTLGRTVVRGTGARSSGLPLSFRRMSSDTG